MPLGREFMRIVQITPGSGDNFYCENCLRDNMLVRALGRLGHDAFMVPLYLPPRMRETGKDRRAPVFYGGINVYLQQKYSIFRKTPRWVDRFFDAPFFLNRAARMAGMTRAKDLGETTVSMLEGEEGRQAKELDRLTAWLGQGPRPDVVILSNALLCGLARRIKDSLGCAVICLLQDEDEFLDALAEPYSGRAWKLLTARAGDVDRFVSVSRYYAAVMKNRLDLPEDRISVVYTGIPVEVYEPASPFPGGTIGFLSRQCHGKGLDLLAEAFLLLKKKEGFKETRLRIAGGKTASDEPFIAAVRQRLDSAGLTGDVEFLEGFEEDRRKPFLRSLSVLSVPERHGEAWGFYVLEALASGVPVVQPALGVFPELLEMTGGGMLYEPGNRSALVEALGSLLEDPGRANDLGMKGRAAVMEKFNMANTARDLAELCAQVLK
jgi:glycosyltransferase involved in cell wall biosynthesis